MWFNSTGANAWLWLIIAGLFETVWVIGMKYAEGFSKLLPSVVTVSALFLSFIFLSQAIKTIPVGVAYAVWTGIGATGAVLFGMLWLKEPMTAIRILLIVLIVTGVIGLKMTGSSSKIG